MQTVAAAIGERVEELRELLREFLLEHSGGLRDINKPSSSLVFVGPHYAWGDLDHGGFNHGCSTTTAAWRRSSARC